MITTAIPDQAKIDLLPGGAHQPGDSYRCALYENTATLDATTPTYTILGEIAGTGYVAGGASLTGFTVFDDTGSNSIVIQFDPVQWTSSTFNADGFIIYNTSKANKIMVIVAFGQTWYVTAGTFLLNLNAPGVIQWFKG